MKNKENILKEEEFIKLINDCIITKENNCLIYKKNDKIYFSIQDNTVYCSYKNVWEIFNIIPNITYSKIEEFITNILKNVYNLKINSTQSELVLYVNGIYFGKIKKTKKNKLTSKENFFIGLLNSSIIRKEMNIINYIKNNYILFKIENNTAWIDYKEIWKVLGISYNMNFNEIQDFIKSILLKEYNIDVSNVLILKK